MVIVEISLEGAVQIAAANRVVSQLLRNIAMRFGNDLVIEKVTDEESVAGYKASDLSYEMKVSLKIGRKNPIAGIAHECLHFQLVLNGLPIALYRNGNDAITVGICTRLADHVQHLLFEDDFYRLGFTNRDLFHNPDFVDDPEKVKQEIMTAQDSPSLSRYARGVMATYYFAALVNGRFGLAENSADLLQVGRQFFSAQMALDAVAMKAWLQRNEYRTNQTYSYAMNQLLTLIGLTDLKFEKLESPPARLRSF